MDSISAGHIFSIDTSSQFETIALETFRYQSRQCAVYAEFIQGLGINPDAIQKVSEIPFLPIQFFKTHSVISGNDKAKITFSSSATGGVPSMHPVTDIVIYEQSFRHGFANFYGDIRDYVILALLPSYLEREGSSLIYMVDDLIRGSSNPQSGYFLYDHDKLYRTLLDLKDAGTPTMLIGVTYALLDFAEQYQLNFPGLIVMETGGMKGKRKEIIREELHSILYHAFGINAIHSEYGMTELLSQSYSKGDGVFACPPWMRITIREINDPFELLNAGQTGGMNVIDLANVNSCSFIATQDLGKLHPNGSFEVLGRFDNSDMRGCNLMVQ